jgi:hypothetical protein
MALEIRFPSILETFSVSNQPIRLSGRSARNVWCFCPAA